MVKIMTCLSFQDLTGQRIKRVIDMLGKVRDMIYELYLSTGILMKAKEKEPEQPLEELMKDAKTKEYRDYFWGGIDAYRIKIAAGRDLVLNPPQAGAPLNTFGYPYAEVGGKVIDWYEPKTFSYRILYREK